MANINLYTTEIHTHKYGLALAVLINDWTVKKDSKPFQVPPVLGLVQPYDGKWKQAAADRRWRWQYQGSLSGKAEATGREGARSRDNGNKLLPSCNKSLVQQYASTIQVSKR